MAEHESLPIASGSTTASPASFTYPFAAAPDIIRANQKDAYYQGLLLEKLSTILRNIYGARVLHKYSAEAKTFAELLYLGLTTLRGTRTLGEEYCDIVHVESGQRAPSLERRAGYILTTVLVPYILSKTLPSLRSRIRRKLTPRPGEKPHPVSAYVLTHLDTLTSTETVLAVHLGVFYFSGAYYHVSKRLWGLRYIFSKRLAPHEQRQGYEVLGVLLLAQLVTQAYFHISGTWGAKEVEEEKEKPRQELVGTAVDLEEEGRMRFLRGELARKCTLCLEAMKDPTATACGHVFCWGCIGEWCRNKPECPLCRQTAAVQQLLPLRG